MASPAPHEPGEPRRSSESERERECGQASIELVALLPLVAVIAALGWQAVVAGQAVWLAGSAARAAARASAVGADARAAARRALPERLRRGVAVRTRGEHGVRVAITIPSVIGAGRLGTVSARARMQDQTR
ncbi:MAG TPA: hypothetical protein VGO80_18960 [Solirubrobacteraceae bacterium]|nr:hypothetical protein [Solirubrobacteraceae bacterium]